MEKKERIIAAAIDLFYEQGLAVPASKIADHAGVSNGTLFNYFETKQLLVDAVFYAIVEDTTNIVKECFNSGQFRDQLFAVWVSLTNQALDNPKRFYVAGLIRQSEAFSESTRLATDNLFDSIFAKVNQIRQKYPEPIPAQLLCELATSQLRAVIAYIIRNHIKPDEAHKILSTAFDAFWRGIFYLE